MKIYEFIDKLRNMSDDRKKIFLWTAVVIFAIPMIYFWVRGATYNLQKIGQSIGQINIPQIQTPATDILQTTTPTNGEAIVQTADWKTYTNSQYGFEIKYPSMLSSKDVSSGNDLTAVKLESRGYGVYSFYIGNSNAKKIVDILSPKLSDYSEVKNGKLTINGIDWKTIEELSIPQEGIGTAGSLLNEYVKKSDVTYIFQCNNCNEDMFGEEAKVAKAIFDQILSTFKFTNTK